MGRRRRGIVRQRQDTTQYHVWRSPFLDGLEIITSTEHALVYPNHLHDALEIILLSSGAGEMVWRGGREIFTQGAAAVIAPNEMHSGRSAPRFSFKLFHVPPAVLEQALGRLAFRPDAFPALPLAILPPETATPLLGRYEAAVTGAASAGEQLGAVAELAAALIAEQRAMRAPADAGVRHPGGHAGGHPAVRRTRAIIREQFACGVGVGELAESVHLDERYLISLFKSATGLPPNQFQIAMRVDLARHLIQRQIPLSAVAALAGFADQSHMNRHFKRQYGMTPGAFQRRTVPAP